LDFGSILSSLNIVTPSVIQLRAQNILPSDIGDRIMKALNQFEDILNEGALIIVDKNRDRARILPLKQ